MKLSQFDQDIATLKKMNVQITSGYHVSGSDKTDLASALARINKLGDILSGADVLTAKLIDAGATRADLIEIVNSYGDSVDWNYHSIDSIVAEVWQSDANSGEDAGGWIINQICRTFNIDEVEG